MKVSLPKHNERNSMANPCFKNLTKKDMSNGFLIPLAWCTLYGKQTWINIPTKHAVRTACSLSNILSLNNPTYSFPQVAKEPCPNSCRNCSSVKRGCLRTWNSQCCNHLLDTVASHVVVVVDVIVVVFSCEKHALLFYLDGTNIATTQRFE